MPPVFFAFFDRTGDEPFLCASALPTKRMWQFVKRSGQGRDRTGDTRIFSPLLYQLSYLSRTGGNQGGKNPPVPVQNVPYS